MSYIGRSRVNICYHRKISPRLFDYIRYHDEDPSFPVDLPRSSDFPLTPLSFSLSPLEMTGKIGVDESILIQAFDASQSPKCPSLLRTHSYFDMISSLLASMYFLHRCWIHLLRKPLGCFSSYPSPLSLLPSYRLGTSPELKICSSALSGLGISALEYASLPFGLFGLRISISIGIFWLMVVCEIIVTHTSTHFRCNVCTRVRIMSLTIFRECIVATSLVDGDYATLVTLDFYLYPTRPSLWISESSRMCHIHSREKVGGVCKSSTRWNS